MSDDVKPFPPNRELRDPRELRALAHPARLSLMEALTRLGPSTATELSEQLEEQSPANCSWHLRQLARYGFVEEASTGPGRQRRWRIVPESTTIGNPDDSAEMAIAIDIFDEVLLNRAVANRKEWQTRSRQESERWLSASFILHSWFWLTSEELEEFAAEHRALIEELIGKAMDRLDPANRPSGSRAVQLMAWAVPVGSEHEAQEDPGEQE